MAGSALDLTHERVTARPRVMVVVAAYAVLGATLVWSRLADLGHSFWLDESDFVATFVRRGPREIVTGPGLSHELYGLLAWLTSTLFGESEIALRLGSAIPFVVGVLLVTAWLHTRVEPLAGVLYLFLATVSPLLLDITRQARGYGLAFLAMSVLVVAGLEAQRTGRRWLVIVACVAGIAGAWTLPQFAVAYAPMCLILVADRRLRWTAVVGLVVSTAAIYVWYAPHTGAVHASSQLPDGLRIGTAWLLTAPLDFTVFPALTWIDGTAAKPGLFWLPLALLAVLVMASSSLARDRLPALFLCAGVVTSVVVLWIGQAYVVPRYLSFLLVPLFVLLSTGASSILSRRNARPPIVRSVACLVVIAVLAFRFVSIAPDVVGLPREANRDVAEIIDTHAEPGTPVLTRVRRIQGLVFYLRRPVHALSEANAARLVCGQRTTVAYVMQPFLLEPVAIPCLSQPGVQHYRFAQYARGNEMDVWLVPPR